VEVGETVKMDDKGRVTLPVGIRKVVSNRAFRVELADKDTIVLRVLGNRNELVEKVKALKLVGDKERAHMDVATVKDFYGGLKH